MEALQQIHGEVRALGAQIVVLTPELERYTQALHKKLNLTTFDMLTDLHQKTAEQFRLVLYAAGLLARSLQVAMHWTGSTMNRNTDCRYLHGTWSTSKG